MLVKGAPADPGQDFALSLGGYIQYMVQVLAASDASLQMSVKNM